MILGDDEVEQGVVRIKELGLPEGHPQKDGELVAMDKLVPEVQKRLSRKRELDDIARQAEGLKVVGGLRGEEAKVEEANKPEEASKPEETSTPEETKTEENKPEGSA